MNLLNFSGANDFVPNTLHVSKFVLDQGAPSVSGVNKDIISDGLSLPLDYSPMPVLEIWDPTQDFSDHIVPDTNSARIFIDNSTSTCVGLRYPKTGLDSTGRVVFICFPIEAIPMDPTTHNDRTYVLGNILNFLSPGLIKKSGFTMDSPEYTIPSTATIELSDVALAGKKSIQITAGTTTEPAGTEFTLFETPLPGVFRGFIHIVAPPAEPGNRLTAHNLDTFWAHYVNANNLTLEASATIDTTAPVISQLSHTEDYT
jgi:hypothetical protein